MNTVDVCIFFQIIKDFYLLGRGELYQVFIDLAQHMLKTPPTAVTEHGKFEHANLIKICEVVFLQASLFSRYTAQNGCVAVAAPTFPPVTTGNHNGV